MLLCSFTSYNFVSRTRRGPLGGCGFLFPLEDLQNLCFHCLVGNSLRVLLGYFVSRPSDSPPSNSLKHESLFWCPCLRSVRDPPYWLLLPSPCFRPLTVTVCQGLSYFSLHLSFLSWFSFLLVQFFVWWNKVRVLLDHHSSARTQP